MFIKCYHYNWQGNNYQKDLRVKKKKEESLLTAIIALAIASISGIHMDVAVGIGEIMALY